MLVMDKNLALFAQTFKVAFRVITEFNDFEGTTLRSRWQSIVSNKIRVSALTKLDRLQVWKER